MRLTWILGEVLLLVPGGEKFVSKMLANDEGSSVGRAVR